MIYITVEQTKTLIERLLSDPFFDGLEMVRLELTTAVTRTVDGKIRREFYDSEEEVRGEYIRWQDEKPNFFQAIRGKVLPLGFKIVFRYPKEESEKLIGRAAELCSLYLNISYDRKNTGITTGVAQNIFPPDQTVGQEWDRFVQEVMHRLDIG